MVKHVILWQLKDEYSGAEIENIKGTEVLESFEEYLDYKVNSVTVYSCGSDLDIVFVLSV